MIEPSQVLIIIPAYNEGFALETTLEDLLKTPFPLLVIDDGSTDNTLQVLQSKPVNYLAHSVNLGQGAALKTGMAWALKSCYKYVVHFDADGQHRSADIQPMLEKMIKDSLDIVLGSRFLDQQLAREIPLQRKWLLKVALFVDRFFSGVKLTDVHNGFRVLNHRAMSEMVLLSNGMAHASEIVWEIKRLSLKYAEAPVKIRYFDQRHKKSQSLYSGFVIFLQLLKLKKKRKLHFRCEM